MKKIIYIFGIVSVLFFMLLPAAAFANYPTDNPNPNCLDQSYWDANTSYCQGLGYPNPSGGSGGGGTTTNPPYSPSGLAIDSSGVLTWTENDSTVTSYNIYVNDTLVGTSTTTSYTFSSLNTGDVVRVAAVNANGENVVHSGDSMTYSGSPIGGSTGGGGTPPTGGSLPAPTNLYCAMGTTQATLNHMDCSWARVTGASGYDVYVDGVLQGTAPSVAGEAFSYDFTAGGSHTIEVAALDSSGVEGQRSSSTVSAPGTGGSTGGGTTTTPTPVTCDGCALINSMMSCPQWSQYMGAWSDMIKNSVPPAPDWQNVANIMRDTIVPAMGQELIDRMPEAAKIIADEFQSREKPVSPPPSIPAFTPTVPTMTDIPTKNTDSITDNVPDFTPDFSQSSPFTIPDPLQMDMSTTDKGYVHNPSPDTSSPAYNKTEAPEPDKGYKPLTEPTISAPSYKNTNAANGAPIPTYKNTNPQESAPIPTYTSTNTIDNSPIPTYNNTSNTSSTIPPYQPH